MSHEAGEKTTPYSARRADGAVVHGILPVGFELGGRLTVSEHLGGTRKVDVYRCRSSRLGKDVVCKVLRAEHALDYATLESMAREGRRLERFRHPNVIEGYGVELDAYPRVIMEFLPGQNLQTTFLEGNLAAFSVGDIVRVAVDLAEGLSYVHDRGVLHLDVKPANAMYHEGAARLFDFSVAVSYSPGKPLRARAGTVRYMSPEQTNRTYLSPAADVFGLGVTLYQLLTGGRRPYRRQAADPQRPRARRTLDYSRQPQPPSRRNPDISPELDEIALRAISADAAGRFATPGDFKAALVAAGFSGSGG